MPADQLRSLDSLRQYSLALASRNVADDPRVRKLQSARKVAWLFILTCAFLLYYLIDRMQEALAMLI